MKYEMVEEKGWVRGEAVYIKVDSAKKNERTLETNHSSTPIHKHPVKTGITTHRLELKWRRCHERRDDRERLLEGLELGVFRHVEHADDRRLRAAQVNRLRVVRE